MAQVNFGLRIPSFPINGSLNKEFITQILKYVEKFENIFKSIWICDHFVPWVNFLSKATPTLEGFTTVSYLSGLFQELYFANIVLCNSYRNPALLAKMSATLQTLSKGRFILGIGAGWKEDEYVSYGYKFPSPKERIQQLEEAVQIIRAMWTKKIVTFKGRYYRIEEAHCYPKPEPLPPIMIGGGGEKLTLKVIARYADWWNLPNVSPKIYHRKLKILKKHCKKEHRTSNIVKTLANIVAISQKEDEALKAAYKSQFVQKGNEENFIIGTPDSIINKLEEFIKLDVKYFIFRFVDFPKTDGAKLFIENVIPSFI